VVAFGLNSRIVDEPASNRILLQMPGRHPATDACIHWWMPGFAADAGVAVE